MKPSFLLGQGRIQTSCYARTGEVVSRIIQQEDYKCLKKTFRERCAVVYTYLQQLSIAISRLVISRLFWETYPTCYPLRRRRCCEETGLL